MTAVWAAAIDSWDLLLETTIGYLLLWLGYDRHAWVLGFKLLSAHTHSRRRETPRGQTTDCSTCQTTERRSSPAQETRRGKGNRRRDPDSLNMRWPPLWGTITCQGFEVLLQLPQKIFKRTVVQLKCRPRTKNKYLELSGKERKHYKWCSNKQRLTVKLNTSPVMLLPCNKS